MNLRTQLIRGDHPDLLGMAVEAKLDGPHCISVPCVLYAYDKRGSGDFGAGVVDPDGRYYECDAELVELVELDGFWDG